MMTFRAILRVTLITTLGAAAPQMTSAAPKSGAATTTAARDPKITINLGNGTVGQALDQIAKAAKWDLVASLPPEVAQKAISLRIKNRPASEVMNMVLKSADLVAETSTNLVQVRVREPLPATATNKTASHTTRGHDDSDDDEDEDERADRDRDDRRAADRSDRSEHRDKKGRVALGGSVHVGANEEVKEAVAMGGTVTVAGKVRTNAVSMGGDVIVEPGGDVRGDAVAMGGEVIVKPGGKVRGDRVAMAGSIGSIISKAISWKKGEENAVAGITQGPTRWYQRYHVIPWLARLLSMLVIGLLFVALVPKRLEQIQHTLSLRPWKSSLLGFVLIAGLIPACLLLLVTIIGIPLVPVAVIGTVATLACGFTVLACRVGGNIMNLFHRQSMILSLIVGVLILVAVTMVPYVGKLAVLALSLVAAGAVLLSRFGKEERNNPLPTDPHISSPA